MIVICAFKHYCLFSAYETCMDLEGFDRLCLELGLTAELGAEALHQIFAACNYDLVDPVEGDAPGGAASPGGGGARDDDRDRREDDEEEADPDAALTRPEFLECTVRLALALRAKKAVSLYTSPSPRDRG